MISFTPLSNSSFCFPWKDKNMKIRFVKNYKGRGVGDTADLPETEARALIGIGLAEEMPAEKPAKKVEKGAQQ